MPKIKVGRVKGDPFTYTDFTQEQLEALKVKGDAGSQIRYAEGVPTASIGIKGDSYVDTSSLQWDLYFKSTDTTWDKMGYLKGDAGGLGGDTVPIGVMMPYQNNTPPDGWLVCDGSAVSRIDYADLFAVIGEKYGSGDGSTTFNLPNEPNPLTYNVTSGSAVQLESHNPELFVVIKAMQLVPIVASIEQSLESGSTVNAPSVKSVRDAISNAAYHKIPEEYEVNGFGIIVVPGEFDPHNLNYCGTYSIKGTPGTMPYDNITAIVTYKQMINDIAVLTVDYRDTKTQWTCYKNAGAWSEWKLTAGEVLLWSGNIEMGVVTTSHDIKRFGHIAFHNNGGFILEGVVNNDAGNIRASEADVYDTNCYLYAITALINTMSLNLIRAYGYTIAGVKTNLVTIKIFGRP